MLQKVKLMLLYEFNYIIWVIFTFNDTVNKGEFYLR